MNTAINKQSRDYFTVRHTAPYLEAELQELEDTYAECLGDNVDAQTLTMLWLKIKAIKKQIVLNTKVA